MVYFLLLISVLILLIINLLIYKDIISPSFIMLVMYLISIIAALVGFKTWNIETSLNYNTYFLVIIGLLGFSFGELLARLIKKIKYKEIKYKETKKMNIEFTNQKYPQTKFTYLILLFILATIFLALFEIVRICKNYGFSGGSIPEMLKYFREKNDILSGGNINATYDLSFLVKQFIKISYVLTVYYEYFFIKSLIEKKNNRIKFRFFLCMFLGMICTLLSTGRSILFHMIYALFIILIIYNRASNNKVNLMEKKYRNKFIAIGLICIFGLYALMPLLGRTNNGSMIESTSFAIGAHIPSLNRILRDKNDDPILEGIHMTFNNAEKSFNRLGFISNYKESVNIWYNFNRYGSNTFTSLFCYYHDFGLFGTFLLQFAFGFFVSYIYISITTKKSMIGLIYYAYFFYTVFDQIRGDQFYGLITLSTIAYSIIIFVMYMIFFKVKNVSVDLNEK